MSSSFEIELSTFRNNSSRYIWGAIRDSKIYDIKSGDYLFKILPNKPKICNKIIENVGSLEIESLGLTQLKVNLTDLIDRIPSCNLEDLNSYKLIKPKILNHHNKYAFLTPPHFEF